jgi:hypothetical protein
MSEETIFTEVLALPDAAARAAYLDRACGTDAVLRRGVEALLAAHERANLLDESLGELAPQSTMVQSSGFSAGLMPKPTMPGDLIAERYRLGKVLGVGGMGTVYRAEQVSPVKRTVALKLIHHGMDTGRVLARFEAERQALAVMDHPGIAKVFDAGTLPNGRPFFAIEFVEGPSLTRYCDDRRLTVEVRLQLFIQIGEGRSACPSEGRDPPRSEAGEHPRKRSRWHAGAEGDRFRAGEIARGQCAAGDHAGKRPPRTSSVESGFLSLNYFSRRGSEGGKALQFWK